VKKAVALGYDKSKVAPEVIAKGFGSQAQILIKRAQELDIAIKEDKILSEALSTLPHGMPIPEDFYQIVASLYAFIQKLEAGRHQ
jgi:flagellar biosynthesis protein